jgi:hypothetical protein
MRFKNVSLHFTALPKTPLVSNIRIKDRYRVSQRKPRLTPSVHTPRLSNCPPHKENVKAIEVLPPPLWNHETHSHKNTPSVHTNIMDEDSKDADEDFSKISMPYANLGEDSTLAASSSPSVDQGQIIQPSLDEIKQNNGVDINSLVSWILGLDAPENPEAFHNISQAEKASFASEYNVQNAPSVISEPVWLGLGSSTIGLQSAPSEFPDWADSFPVMSSLSHTPSKSQRRRGPLRPEQRQRVHEIPKLRACLRCKRLKKAVCFSQHGNKKEDANPASAIKGFHATTVSLVASTY